jgi:hypothetical protein
MISIQLILQFQIIGYHGDKLAIRRLSAVVLDGVAKVRIKRIHVASVPSHLYRVTDGTFNAACGGLVFAINLLVYS